jgi:hypothetical protein
MVEVAETSLAGGPALTEFISRGEKKKTKPATARIVNIKRAFISFSLLKRFLWGLNGTVI